MDDHWLSQFDFNATTSLPEHQICCWSKSGFDERTRLFPKLLRRLQGVKTVLDVGCGTGYYCRLLKSEGYEVTGVDYAPNMVLKAKSLAPDIEFQEAHGYQLPFADDSFDLVISIGVLQCLEDDERFIAEIKRVAKKAIIISTLRRATRTRDMEAERARLFELEVAAVRTYHPDDIMSQLDDWKAELILKDGDVMLNDCFFILAVRGSSRPQ